MKPENVIERIQLLKEIMEKKQIDIYVIPTSDFHNSEYVGDYFKVREFFSGFTGSNGTLVVTHTECGLWTDGRYFIQAEKELEGTGIVLYRIGDANVPTIAEYIRDFPKEKLVLGFDGRVCTKSYVDGMLAYSEGKEIIIYDKRDLADSIWTDRPLRAKEPVYVLSEDITGCSSKDKIEKIRTEMKANKADGFFLSKLDDIMWMYNIRGNDVECNPVALSYGFITNSEQYLFIQKEALTKEVSEYLEDNHVSVREYDDVFLFLDWFSYPGKIMMDEHDTSYRIYEIIAKHTEVLPMKNPTELLKAVKNETELELIHHYYELDSAAVCKFIYWIKHNDGKDEVTAGKYIDSLREQIQGFMGLSFPTICAYQENAAMMHYEAGENCNKPIRKEGMLLVDSGGQYMGATTDVTRTICLGQLSEEEKKYFTLVAVGMLRCMNAKFLHGCSGRNLDILAREPLWAHHVDYKCGTGHGVGAFLNVHEGPQSIRWKYIPYTLETVLEEGMLITDEPGVYFEGKFGIRTENVLLVQKEIENGDGQFMCFEPLTLAPIDLDGISTEYMSEEDRKMLNEYHRIVYEKMESYMDEDEKKWLKEVTREI